MKKLLLILALALSANAWTSISGDVHEKCKDAKDYVGCMKFYSEDALIEKNNKKEIKDSEIPAQIDIGRMGGQGSGVKIDLFIDDKYIVSHKGKSAISVKVEPGERIFCYATTRSKSCNNKFGPIDKSGDLLRGGRILIKLEPNQRICLKSCTPFWGANPSCNYWEYISCDQWDLEFTKSGKFRNSKRLTKINY